MSELPLVKNDMLHRDCVKCEFRDITQSTIKQGYDIIPNTVFRCKAEIGDDMKCPKNPFIRIDRL